jgi:hypothetical protein
MEKQEAKSKWDELGRQLGAEISAEAEQLVETGPAPPVEPASYLSGTASEQGGEPLVAPPKRPSAGWDNLASEFGLPVFEEPPAPAVDEVVAVSKPLPVPRVADSERPRRERPGQDRRERYGKRRESEKGREPSPRHREGSPRRHDAPQRRRKPPELRDERERVEEVADTLPPERNVPPAARHAREERRAEPVEEPPKPGAAISLWHKIFGSPADQSAKLEEISTRSDEDTAPPDSVAEQSIIRDAEIDRDRAIDDEFAPRERDEFARGVET